MPAAIKVYDTLGSTQTEALKALRQGHAGPCWIQAIEQTQGMGRRGKKWESLKGNLMASWYGVLAIDIAVAPQLAFVSAMAVRDLMAAYVTQPEALKIKWPNDILYQGAKVCGILVQTESFVAKANPFSKETLEGLGVVVGIGINLKSAPKLMDYPTTALMDIASQPQGLDLDPVLWIKPLSEHFELRLQAWLEEGFEPLAKAWCACAYGLGQKVRIQDQDRSFEGVIEGLSSSGALLIKNEADATIELTSGEIVFAEARCS